jgi:hypothetical protein
MSEKNKSETLAQREKARKDFLELKAMQAKAKEEGSVEHTAYENEIKPKTFGEKISHFFYYHWRALIITVLCLCVVIFATVSCFNKKKPDLKVLIYDNRILADMYVPEIQDYFAQFCNDYNNDGEVYVQVINCTYQTGVSTAQYQNTMMQRLQSVIVTDSECMLIITSDMGKKYFDDYLDGVLCEEGTALKDEYYNCAFDEDIKIPEDVKIYLRNINGTLLEDNEKSVSAVTKSKEFIENMSK